MMSSINTLIHTPQTTHNCGFGTPWFRFTVISISNAECSYLFSPSYVLDKPEGSHDVKEVFVCLQMVAIPMNPLFEVVYLSANMSAYTK